MHKTEFSTLLHSTKIHYLLLAGCKYTWIENKKLCSKYNKNKTQIDGMLRFATNRAPHFLVVKCFILLFCCRGILFLLKKYKAVRQLSGDKKLSNYNDIFSMISKQFIPKHHSFLKAMFSVFDTKVHQYFLPC